MNRFVLPSILAERFSETVFIAACSEPNETEIPVVALALSFPDRQKDLSHGVLNCTLASHCNVSAKSRIEVHFFGALECKSQKSTPAAGGVKANLAPTPTFAGWIVFSGECRLRGEQAALQRVG